MGHAVDVAKDYAAGMASGVAMVAAGHPFDTIKVSISFSTSHLAHVFLRKISHHDESRCQWMNTHRHLHQSMTGNIRTESRSCDCISAAISTPP